MTAEDVATFSRCMSVGGVALFPTDTVYGLATEPESAEGHRRLYALKRRPPGQPAAVMFFALDLLEAALPELGPRTRGAVGRLLPGPVTLVIANPARRFPLACGPDPSRLGIRLPELGEALSPMADIRWPVLQSSANRSGGEDARRIEQVDDEIRAGVDMQLDGGPLEGEASTVVDLYDYEDEGGWRVLRPGPVSEDMLSAVL